MREMPELTSAELYLWGQGTFVRSYLRLGAQLCRQCGAEGVRFSVWAPGVAAVSVVGDFNGWRGGENPMAPVESSGIWTAFVSGVKEGGLYKYLIETADGGQLFKADPYAFSAELRPGTASRVADLNAHAWRDESWLARREETSFFDRPMNIYEVHLGSWKTRGGAAVSAEEVPAAEFYSYRELAGTLVPYAREMGYTHLELMPVMEHPYDGSWGYQVTGYFAPTSRYGTPGDFMAFVDACHHAGLGVILDWVPGHFCRDAHGLGRFTGEKLYERDEHAQWGTYKFDLGRPEVRSFLLSNALFWLDIYHIDGLRVDGVSSMLYLNFGVEDVSKHRKNSQGGDSDPEAVSFLKEFNALVGTNYPGVFTAAEESTAWPLVTYPPDRGGLGFHYKWNMGWMNDTLKYMSLDFPSRPSNHRLLTFSMMYAFSENFILPLSHDEVVHGKRSLIGRMPGDYWRQFAGLRLLALWQMCHPGAKLSFMGGEFGQFIEWRYYEGLEWFLLDYDAHRQHRHFIKTLNHVFLREKALWEAGRSWRGFQWLDADNAGQSVLLFLRRGADDGDIVITALNFTPATLTRYKIGVPLPGQYKEILSSDDPAFGGSGKTNPGVLTAGAVPMHGLEYSLEITVPPLGGTMLKPQ
ncbi:1,4-alpha-glucan branching enzyme [Sporobacter termitidis DSM 10068]|uniref:1,4-alpha-glucan branching enzyme GlgB n=1 Tax=Sporobacter termitidis DSM 10068 TaxID=1123282 RepID=A0A1M5YNE4_9FIRM|nr:1,4-alpha-glucan branching protein GlgB [Sporobacter termitidis]SHI13522.1 1,4-alpha-glucan branching enzyme [Sporobacter termitidis DSM 10068]